MSDAYRVRMMCNPYPETIPGDTFEQLLTGIAAARTLDVQRRYADGEYPRASMAFVLLDPTSPMSRPADDIVMAVIEIGPNGGEFVPNAMAKVFAQHDHQFDGGMMAHLQPHRLADGNFRFGGSVCVDGSQVGSSGQTEQQDRLQSTIFAADFNYRVFVARELWAQAHGPGRWFSAEEKVPGRFNRLDGSGVVAHSELRT